MVTDKKNTNPAKKRLVLGCGALVYDLLRLIKQNPALSDKVNLQCLPASWHNTPQLIAPGVEEYLAENSHLYKEVYIAYAEALRSTLGDGALSTMKADTDANMSQCLSCARQIYQNFMQTLR